MNKDQVLQALNPTSTTVTMPVEELAKLVKHAENSLFFYNLPRTNTYQYHRCLKVELRYEMADDPELRFVLEENSRTVEMATHKLSDIFRLLPRLAAFLKDAPA
jgi:hypothetical protein